MRRLVLSMLVASSVALLTACGQGGSAFNSSNNNKVDRVDITTAGQPPGVIKVVPGGTVVLSAIGGKGSNNVIVAGDTNYTWNWTIAPAGTLYQGGNGAQDGTQGFCNGVTGFNFPLVTTATSILTGTPVPIIGTGTSSDSINFTPPSVAGLGPASAVTAFTDAAGNKPNSGNLASSYCITVNATHTSDGVVGSKTIYVGN